MVISCPVDSSGKTSDIYTKHHQITFIYLHMPCFILHQNPRLSCARSCSPALSCLRDLAVPHFYRNSVPHHRKCVLRIRRSRIRRVVSSSNGNGKLTLMLCIGGYLLSSQCCKHAVGQERGRKSRAKRQPSFPWKFELRVSLCDG